MIYIRQNETNRKSLPLRGAWIEIVINKNNRPVNMSLPLRGAWIEIPDVKELYFNFWVAPPAGSVD